MLTRAASYAATHRAGRRSREASATGLRAALGVFGECCLTAGVIVLLYLAYLIWGTALQASQHQHAFAAQLQREWQATPGVKPVIVPLHLVTGQPFAFIRIPRFGRGWRFAIVQGTGLPQLALGPGHVPGTALPGQAGNFAVAAHRVTAGNPFYHLGDLRAGDKVLIDTRSLTYVYRVARSERVLPDDTAVLDPVPGHPRRQPHHALITLITCDPPWTGTHRIIVFGTLVAEKPRVTAHR